MVKVQFVLFLKKDSEDGNFPNITMVGIDDFAIKKHKYETVMVNHDNNNIISMINSRDIGEVS